jgi:hypothetical protein
MEPSVLVVLAVMALLATGAVFMAVRASRMRRYLHDTPTSSTAGVFIGDVEVKGIASSEAPLRTYLSETLCGSPRPTATTRATRARAAAGRPARPPSHRAAR